MTNKYRSTQNKKLRASLLLFAAYMLGFAFVVLPPLYTALREVTGLGGSTKATAGIVEETADPERLITLEFVTIVDELAAWEFTALVDDMTIPTGKLHDAFFFALNLTAQHKIAQAVTLVSPPQAAKYFRKLDCFCFSSQAFAPGEFKEMPVRLIVASDLPETIDRIRLSYTIFDTARVSQAIDDSPAHEQTAH